METQGSENKPLEASDNLSLTLLENAVARLASNVDGLRFRCRWTEAREVKQPIAEAICRIVEAAKIVDAASEFIVKVSMEIKPPIEVAKKAREQKQEESGYEDGVPF